jgi:alpha-galactosidase
MIEMDSHSFDLEYFKESYEHMRTPKTDVVYTQQRPSFNTPSQCSLTYTRKQNAQLFL